MADSSMIPGIVDHIVKEEIIPLLPWHTRPLLMVLSRAWRNALDAIAVQGGNRLDAIGERIARATRFMQPLKCRVAVEYCHRPRHRQNSPTVPGYVVKVFDGQWRNVPRISGNGTLFGVVDGTLYYGERLRGRNLSIRIVGLDVGGGLWEWQEICRRHNHPHDLLFISRSSRVAGELYVYRKFRTGLPNDSYFDIMEVPEREQIIDSAPPRHLRHVRCSPLPIFVEAASKLYFFGSVSYTEHVQFFDLNTRTWNDSMVETYSGDHSLNVEKNVVLVGYNYEHFHILRYDSLNERWIIVAWMSSPEGILLCWTWCVEYDQEGEKQLWIYIRSYREDEGFNLCKWQVVERLREGRLMGKVWDDVVLRGGEVECQLINRTSIEEPFQRRVPLTICCSSIHGFHRSDSINFADIPRANVPI